MMMNLNRKNQLGFSLVEMAIVLAITGVLFAGLYRLFSGGNQQVKDTSTASQQVQLAAAVKGFLNSTSGQKWMQEYTSTTLAVNITLPLPAVAPDGVTNAGCMGATTDPIMQDPQGDLPTFCGDLPPGFEGPTGTNPTLNPYGQSYDIQVQVPATPVNSTPSTYSFMILTNGGDTIPDADGGAISAQIGNDGGFIYTSPVCTAAASTTTACGTYGSWSASITGTPAGFGFTIVPGAGHIASRTYVAPEFFSSLPWLARTLLSPDAATPNKPQYNTMFTPMFLGTTSTGVNTFYLGQDSTLPTGGGKIQLQGGGIWDGQSNGTAINFKPYYPGAPQPYLSNANNFANAYINLQTGCSVDQNTANNFLLHYTTGDAPSQEISIGETGNDCQSAIQVTGDSNFLGMVQAYSFFSKGFIYQTSDLRIKTDIMPIPNALDDVMKMKPVSFAFKSNGQKGLGFIAQDIEKIYPDLVAPHEGKGLKAINYEGLIAPLTSAVQQLKQQNDDLRHQLHEQQMRQDRLEKEIQDKSVAQ